MTERGGAMPINAECPRHGLPWTPSMKREEPYYVVRCAHIGSRFVVNIRSWDLGFNSIDFVEDLPGGDLIIEPCHSNDASDAAMIFASLCARMLAGESPQPED